MRTPVEIQMRAELAEAVTLAVWPIDEVAETIRDDAVEFARQQVDGEDAGLMSLLGRRDFLEIFKYGLESKIAEVLAATDRNVLAVYAVEADLNPEAEISGELPLDVTAHLLVHVSVPSAALQAFIGALDRALLASLKELPSPLFRERAFILDVNLITEQDIQQRIGFAKLLTSPFAPPLKVWQREE
jgi:hypothetical protein